MKPANSSFVKQNNWIDKDDKQLEDACVDCFRNSVAVCRHPKRIFGNLDIMVIKEYIKEGLNLDEIAEALNRDKEHMLLRLRGYKGVPIVRAAKRSRKTARVSGIRQNDTGRYTAYAHNVSSRSNER